MDSSLNDISQLIRIKEKELHEIHDQRCGQLEQLISERDSLLIDSSKRFDQLRDDFQYNLALLEARDHEIERLEGHVLNITTEMTGIDNERRAFQGRIEIMEIKETERSEKHEENKLANKRILQELKDVIESMRWASSEESKTKVREIDNLKDQLHKANVSREEALELQRRDLTSTFEALIQQREESFGLRERDIGFQVGSLDKKFEQLQTENSRLKAENMEANRKVDALSDESSAKEEHLRQLQWRLDDERNSKQQGDDLGHRKVHQLSIDLVAAKDKAAQDLSDLTKSLEKARGELSREKEHRVNLERQVLECHTVYTEELNVLNSEIAEFKKCETEMRREYHGVCGERDDLRERCRAMLGEIEALNTRNQALGKEIDGLRGDSSSSRTRSADSEARLVSAEDALKEARQQVNTAELALADRTASLESTAAQLTDSANRLAFEIETSKRYLKSNQELEAEFSGVCRERDDVRAMFEEVSRDLEEERMEGKALRLRLSVQEVQAAECQQRMQILQNEQQRNEAFSLGLVVGAGVESEDIAYVPSANSGTGHFYNTQSFDHEGLGVSSLAFSEDFGPASFVDSPAPSAFRGTSVDRDWSTYGSQRYRDDSQQQQQHQQQQKQQQQLQQQQLVSSSRRESPVFREEEYQGSERSAVQRNPVSEENERLKSVIREMRLDVETLQQQILEPSGGAGDGLYFERPQGLQDRAPKDAERAGDRPGDGSGRGTGEGNNFGLLEQRLEQTVSEVTRLRNERSRLMDVGNELRAALNRQNLASTDPSRLPGSANTTSPAITPFRVQRPDPYSGNSRNVSSEYGSNETGRITLAGDAYGSLGERGATVAWTDRAFRDQQSSAHDTPSQPLYSQDPRKGYEHQRSGSMDQAVVRGSSLAYRGSPVPGPFPASSYASSSSARMNQDNHQYGIGMGMGRDYDSSGIPPPNRGAAQSRPPPTGVNPTTPRGPSGFSSSIPVALTNSNRTTLSQIKARKRIQQSASKPSEEPMRRIFNYARGREEDDAALEVQR